MLPANGFCGSGRTYEADPRHRGRNGGGSAYGGSLAPASTGEQLSDAQLLNVLQNEMLGMNAMHQAGYTGEGVSVAVFDGGFRAWTR